MLFPIISETNVRYLPAIPRPAVYEGRKAWFHLSSQISSASGSQACGRHYKVHATRQHIALWILYVSVDTLRESHKSTAGMERTVMREKISSPTLGNENVPDEMTIITVLMPKLANPGRRGVIEDARVPRLPTREACTAPFYRRAQWGFPDMTDSLRKVRYGSSSSYSVAEGYR